MGVGMLAVGLRGTFHVSCIILAANGLPKATLQCG
jgi:hypothetical protein